MPSNIARISAVDSSLTAVFVVMVIYRLFSCLIAHAQYHYWILRKCPSIQINLKAPQDHKNSYWKGFCKCPVLSAQLGFDVKSPQTLPHLREGHGVNASHGEALRGIERLGKDGADEGILPQSGCKDG